MFIPDKDHPIWKVIQSLLSVIGISIWVYHASSGHTLKLDATDATGIVGGGLAGKLGYEMLRNFIA